MKYFLPYKLFFFKRLFCTLKLIDKNVSDMHSPPRVRHNYLNNSPLDSKGLIEGRSGRACFHFRWDFNWSTCGEGIDPKISIITSVAIINWVPYMMISIYYWREICIIIRTLLWHKQYSGLPHHQIHACFSSFPSEITETPHFPLHSHQ